jgi:hypothetical protein
MMMTSMRKIQLKNLLATDLDEEYGEYGLHPIFGGLYPEEDDLLGEEAPTNDVVEYYEDEDLSGEVPNYNEEEVDYVDFLGVEDILNSPNNDLGEFYTDEENYMFTKETTAGPLLSIFMAHGREKEREKNDKSEVLPNCVWDFCDNHQGIPMMRSVTLILGCGLVLILRKGEWNELTGHPKDLGKNLPNSRRNSLQCGENDADQILFKGPFGIGLDLAIEHKIECPHVLDHTCDGTRAHTGGIVLFLFLLL